MKSKKINVPKEIKSIARERVGPVKSTKVIKSKKDKYMWKDENVEECRGTCTRE